MNADNTENMTDCWLPPICVACHRATDSVKHKWLCFECFVEWYDGCGSTNPVVIGNATRSKHGLPPLDPGV